MLIRFKVYLLIKGQIKLAPHQDWRTLGLVKFEFSDECARPLKNHMVVLYFQWTIQNGALIQNA